MTNQTTIYANVNGFQPDFNGEFERARTQIATPFAFYDIDLSVARSNVIIPIAGDFLFADLSTNGIATIELNNQQNITECPIEFAAGMAFKAPFKQLKVSNAAQAGATMRLLYSTGYSIVPSSSMANINQILQPVNINDVVSSNCQIIRTVPAYAIGFNVSAMVTPAQNVNGLIIRSVYFDMQAGVSPGNVSALLIASPTAPTSDTSTSPGYCVGRGFAGSSAYAARNIDQLYRKIPPNWGLYACLNAVNVAASGGTFEASIEIL